MTYCVAMLLDDGLVFGADTRTNAGVDQIASVRKLSVFGRPGERVVMLLSSGNLAITQAAVTLLTEWLDGEDEECSLYKARTMFRVARIVGRAVRAVHAEDAEHLRQHNTDFSASLIVGGQIRGEPPRLFSVYAAGNFIEASAMTPYFQSGEVKYGKPILDRILTPHLGLGAAAKLALISFDSTLRSNISVGPPIDLACYRRDSFAVPEPVRIAEDDAYFQAVRRVWNDGLIRVFAGIDDPAF